MKKGDKSSKLKKGSDHFGVVDLDADGVENRRAALSYSDNVLVEPIPLSRNPSAGCCVSLGTGEFPISGPIRFTPSAEATVSTAHWSTMSNCTSTMSDEDDLFGERGSVGGASSSFLAASDLLKAMKSKSKDLSKEITEDIMSVGKDIADIAMGPFNFVRKNSVFMRTADLGMRSSSHSYHHEGHDELHPHYHHPSEDPPPGVDQDPKEAWVALDTGEGQHAPVAPYAVDALAKSGLESAMNKSMWAPNRPTDKLLGRSTEWASAVWKESGAVSAPPRGSADEKEVLVWSGNFTHGFYGSDLPTVRAEGIINMAPSKLVDLLLDSKRVHEYNKMSLGRSDVLVLQDDLEKDGPFGQSVTKVVRSESKPPLVRKTMEFVTLMHARKLEDGNGYLIVSRAVTHAEEAVNSDGKVLRSEILMGVNVIRNVEGDEDRAVMINVNHIRSPMVPMMIAKKIGLSAAVGFFNDLRALC